MLVAWIERSEIQGRTIGKRRVPDFTSFNPGYVLYAHSAGTEATAWPLVMASV